MSEVEWADWKASVRKGAELAKAISRSSWALGDLALRLFPVRSENNVAPLPANINGTVRTLTDFADAIEMSPKVLARMRAVSMAWPAPQRRPRVSWSTHRELMHHPDRFSLIYDGMSRRDALKLVENVRESNIIPVEPTAPADRAVIEARAALAIAGDKRRKFDPETREAMLARATELEEIARQIRRTLGDVPEPPPQASPRRRRLFLSSPVGVTA